MRMMCSFASHGGDPGPTNGHLHDGEKLEIETATPDVEHEIRARLDDWPAMLRRNIPQGRQVLRKLLTAPLRFQPVGEAWTLSAALGKLLMGLVVANSVASPTPASWNQFACWLRQIDDLRPAG